MDLINTVVDHVRTLRYDDLDERTIDTVKLLIIDAMGAATAGSRGEGIEQLVGLLRDWGGKPEASVLVYGDRVPAINAALVNGAMARAWDIDDAHEAGGGHLSASVVPTAFILAQCVERRISGKELIVAVALATDLACRLRLALGKHQYGWVIETFVPFAVVAMASRFLGFDRERTLNAMGLAYTQCSCNSQGVVDGALSVRLQQGLGAKAGVLAAQFARIGFTGPRNVLEGVFGLYPLYGRNSYDPAVLTNGLGKHFEIVNSSIKPYPSCKHTHIPIATVSRLVRDHDIRPADITRVIVRTNQAAYDKCASNPVKRRPTNVVDAQFSIPVMVALAATNGGVSLGDLIDRRWESEPVLDIADKVDVKVDPDLDAIPLQIVPNVIEIETSAGNWYRERVEYVKGSPQDPMRLAECVDKFNECVAFAQKPIAASKINQFIEMTSALERVEDVRPMAEMLVA